MYTTTILPFCIANVLTCVDIVIYFLLGRMLRSLLYSTEGLSVIP